jgi:hypothetical protein
LTDLRGQISNLEDQLLRKQSETEKVIKERLHAIIYDKEILFLMSFFRIPGRKWARLRYENIANYTMVCVPAYCGKCDDECPFIYAINNYLAPFIPRNEGDHAVLNPITGVCCSKCRNKSILIYQQGLFPV